MEQEGVCGECGAGNLPVAHFCSQCGRPLDASPQTVGRVAHPAPSAVPDGYRKCDMAADLYFSVGSAWGGTRLLGTENLGVSIFNAGYSLKNVELRVEGRDGLGHCVCEFCHKLADAPRRAELSFEVPSYEISDAPAVVTVTLVSAEYSR